MSVLLEGVEGWLENPDKRIFPERLAVIPVIKPDFCLVIWCFV